MSDEIALRYVAHTSELDGWCVYRVRRGNWHDRIRSNLSESEARALVEELEASRR
jgi:hypothetical protein